MKYSASISVVCLIACHANGAGSIDISGNLGLDYRYFQDASGSTDRHTLEAVFEPEFEFKQSDDFFLKFKGFLREGTENDDRSQRDVRELYWAYNGDNVDVTLGIAKVFWGVTESRHLVDIVNQVDLPEGILEEEKLGQPMINFTLVQDWGIFSFYWLPYFRNREFPEDGQRFILNPVIDTSREEYSNGRHNDHRDFALRYSISLNEFDIGISLFDGYGRQPWFLPSADLAQLIPTYSTMTQLGIDLQYTSDAWLWKFEGIANENRFENFYSSVSGFEYTFFQIFDTSADYGVLIEYLYSNKDKVSPDIFENDVFFGGRLVLNNIQNTSLLAGIVVDTKTQESLIRIESEMRIGQHWTIGLNSIIFENENTGFSSFENDSYLEFKIRYYY